MTSALSAPRKASYALVVLALAAVPRFDLGPALLAGLFAFMLLGLAEEALRGAGASSRAARWSAAALFAVVGVLLAAIFVSFIEVGVSRLPLLLDRLLPRLDALAGRFGLDLPVENVAELRRLILKTVEDHGQSATSASSLLTRGFFQIVVAVAVAVLRFLSGPMSFGGEDGLDAEFFRECGDRAALFSASFERVMGAQMLMAAVNAGLAALFLFSLRIPFRTMLTLATFICGMVPIVGNLISNTLIVAAALTRSDRDAMAALIFLVVVHKGGYFLYGRIVGRRIQIPTWAILLGLLVGEAVLGVTGAILAPALIYYVREELRAIPAR